MSDSEGIKTARITIVRTLTEDDVIDEVTAVDGEGDDLPLTEALGMLRLAEDTVIRQRIGGRVKFEPLQTLAAFLLLTCATVTGLAWRFLGVPRRSVRRA